MLKKFRSRVRQNVVTLVLMTTLPGFAGARSAQTNRSAATIAGSFADSCRDFEAHSNKDISYVQFQYADGRVVKDESITTPDHSLDGGVGDELDFVVVKSGTTTKTFSCAATNSPPTAILEVQIWPECTLVGGTTESWFCFQPSLPPTVWVDAATVAITCGDGGVPCDVTLVFRRTSSTDADNDLASWSIVIDGITVASGAWSDPPAELSLSITPHVFHEVTLTVTDSAGQSDSDTMIVFHGPLD